MPYGDSLRRRREAAKLTQEELAEAAMVSLRSVQRYESGEAPRGDNERLIEEALARIEHPAIDPPVDLADPPRPATAPFIHTPWPDWFVDPDYDPPRRRAEYERIIKTANGAAVDNRWLWSSTQQCADWIAFVRSGQVWAQRLMAFPYTAVAECIMANLPTREIDMIAIGSGMGMAETNLVRELQAAGADVRLVLIDLSSDVLIAGTRRTAKDLPGVQLLSILGEGYHVDRWPWLVTAGRARVWMTLGHTAHDLGDVEALHRAARPGDLIVADIFERYGEATNLDLVRRWIGSALERMQVGPVEFGEIESAGYPRMKWITGQIGPRMLKLDRFDLRTCEASREQVQGMSVQTITTIPAVRSGAVSNVWVGRRLALTSSSPNMGTKLCPTTAL